MSGAEPALHGGQAPLEDLQRLHISLGESMVPPSPEHNLLVGFHFGTSRPQAVHPAVISLDLPPVKHDQLFESWWYRGDVNFNVNLNNDTVWTAECRDYSVVAVRVEENGSDDLQSATCDAYEALMGAVHSTRHRRIIKIWNYLGGINCGEDDLERYRQFSVGRARIFHKHGIRDEDAPTGTAVGTSADAGITLIALASSGNCGLTENPRQVSAFRYPRQYGPSSPKFSRGGFVASSDHRLFLISGTAAVVGHESAWPYDVALQTDETLKNLDLICKAVSELDADGPGLELNDNSALRVYLRDPDDHGLVAAKLEEALGGNRPDIAFLRGFICRRELVVEIDGVQVIAH